MLMHSYHTSIVAQSPFLNWLNLCLSKQSFVMSGYSCSKIYIHCNNSFYYRYSLVLSCALFSHSPSKQLYKKLIDTKILPTNAGYSHESSIYLRFSVTIGVLEHFRSFAVNLAWKYTKSSLLASQFTSLMVRSGRSNSSTVLYSIRPGCCHDEPTKR